MPPYARRGALWETYKRHYGPNGDPAILVAQGATRDLNPDLPQSIIDRAMDRDAAAASAEYIAQFRTDVEAFITREAVEACTNAGVFERPPDRKHSYVGFVDPSGGSSDAMSPEAVVEEYAALLRTYRCTKVFGDRYGGEWPREQFQKRHVYYEPAENSNSEIYQDLLPLINSGAVDLLENERLIVQLTQLERRTARGGKDSIDHTPGAHDDVANAVAGALVTAFKDRGIPGFDRPLDWSKYGRGLV